MAERKTFASFRFFSSPNQRIRGITEMTESNVKSGCKKPSGKLAVLTIGLGAVSTTFMAGVELSRKGLGKPIGSLTQMGTAAFGKNDVCQKKMIKELVPLADLNDLVFGAWDVVGEDGLTVARRSAVLNDRDIAACADFLKAIKPRPGIHDPAYVRELPVDNAMKAQTAAEKVAQVRQDIREMKKELGADRAVMLFTASTEKYHKPGKAHESLAAFEKAIADNDPSISPTMIYIYAGMLEGCPFINGTPNYSVDLPAIQELAKKQCLPMGGKDLKSGQTMMKTVLAPAFKARMLGLRGWFSTNILGNRDGEVLNDPEAFHSKEVTKTGVLDTILDPNEYPDLYGDYHHMVRINYYRPRGDEKEGWDNIDIMGWLGYPMQIKVNFLCRDSILAAPLCLDLVLFMDFARNQGWHGIQEWLSFYFKSPNVPAGHVQENDLFIQLTRLKNTLRVAAGEAPITRLGLEYYGDDLPVCDK